MHGFMNSDMGSCLEYFGITGNSVFLMFINYGHWEIIPKDIVILVYETPLCIIHLTKKHWEHWVAILKWEVIPGLSFVYILSNVFREGVQGNSGRNRCDSETETEVITSKMWGWRKSWKNENHKTEKTKE